MNSDLVTRNNNLVLPEIPEDAEWDYASSVGKVGAFVFKWKTLKAEAPEVLEELWIARQKLSVGHRPKISETKVPLKTWTDYCQEIGSSRQVVNRWLARAGYLAIARQKNLRRHPYQQIKSLDLEKKQSTSSPYELDRLARLQRNTQVK